MNADSDASTVCPDSVDSCVSPALKVNVCIECYYYFGVVGYCAKSV